MTTTSATLSFSAGTGSTTYLVTTTPAGGTATTQTITASPVNLTGLTPATTYTVSVVSNCGGGLTSPPANLTFSTLAIPPVNDDCAGAINVPIQFVTCTTQTTGTTAAATASAGVSAPTCANYQGADIWFKVTVPASGSVTIRTTAPSGGSPITDTGMTVYSGSCAALTDLGCNDDTSGNGLYSQLAFTGRTPGEVLYVRVWAYGNNNTGPIAVCALSPSNCAAPTGATSGNLTNTTATLNWATPAGGLPAGNTYEIEYGVQGFVQGTGTAVTGIMAANLLAQ